ncbi:MAG: hypothetical protein P9L99_14990 [Candidatus Lernaella stagnicola]|nr:hypothetical protein [Candidatus Lernaella stagnicola]
MIAEQILITDVDARQWINLLAMFGGDGGERPSILVCLMDEERCIKAWHSQKGVLWDFRFGGQGDLEEVRHAADAEFLLLLPRCGFQEIFYHAQSRVDPFDDYLKQLLDLVGGVQDAMDEIGRWYPKKPFTLKLPTYASLDGMFNRLWPDNTTLGFFVFDRRHVHTSVILGKASGQINLFTTLDAFGMGENSLDFRMGHKTVADMIAQRYAPLHAALFIELPCFQEMRRGSKPATYLHLAEQRGRALIYPKPFSLRWRLWAARKFTGR